MSLLRKVKTFCYMSAGAETWYSLCEQLCARPVFQHELPPLTLRFRRDLDVNMADTPRLGTPFAGKKRSRDDDGDEDIIDIELRYEKAGSGERHGILNRNQTANKGRRKHALDLATAIPGHKILFSIRLQHR